MILAKVMSKWSTREFIYSKSSVGSTKCELEESTINCISNQTTNMNENLDNTEFVSTTDPPMSSFQNSTLSRVSVLSSVEGEYYLDKGKNFSIHDSSFSSNLTASSTVKIDQDGELLRNGASPLKSGGINSKYKTKIFAFMGVNIFLLCVIIGVIYGNHEETGGMKNYNVTTPLTIETLYLDENDDFEGRFDNDLENGK